MLVALVRMLGPKNAQPEWVHPLPDLKAASLQTPFCLGAENNEGGNYVYAIST